MEVFFKDVLREMDKKNINPLTNRLLYCILPVLLCWFGAYYVNAMYQTMDDWDIRLLLSGFAGGSVAQPSAFSLYMNVLYGYFLRFFYNLYQYFSWYDFFTYLFCSLSLFMISFSLTTHFNSDSWFKKCVVFIIITLVGSIAFISPQFTITAGLLTISGVLIFFILITDAVTRTAVKNACTLFCFFSLLFSSLIRFDACMITGFYMGILLLPYWPYKQLGKKLTQISIMVVTLAAMLGTYWGDSYITSKNLDWNNARAMNVFRVNIADKTNMWDHLNAPWKDIEDKVVPSSEYHFSKGDYRLLLTTYFLGLKSVLTPENFEKVSNALHRDVQSSNRKSFDLIKDYQGVLPWYLALVILLLCYSVPSWKHVLFVCCSFLLLILCLRLEFRALPYRLWYNFAFASLIVILLKANLSLLRPIPISVYLLAIFLIFIPSFKIMHCQGRITKGQYNVMMQFKKDAKKLSNQGTYLLNFAEAEHMARPFSNPFLKNFVILSPLNIDNNYKNILKKNNLSQDDLWNNVCARDSKVRLLHSKAVYSAPVKAVANAITYYMKEKYDADVVFLEKRETPNLRTYQCRKLTPVESAQRADYQDFMKEFRGRDRVADVLMLDYAKSVLGHNATHQELVDLLNILQADGLEDFDDNNETQMLDNTE